MDKPRKKGIWKNIETAVSSIKEEEKEKDSYDIPGVTKVVITPIVQEEIGCVVGQDVTVDDPCVYIKKEILEENISVFLPVKQEIIEYPEKDVLLVLNTKANKTSEDFFVCTTTKAKESILNVLEQEKDQLHLKMKSRVEKTPRKWKSLGSELEIDETLPRNLRSLIEIETVSKWPIAGTRVKFSMRLAEEADDGYMEFVPIRAPLISVYRRKIEAASQVVGETISKEAQTNPSYPLNSWTQYQFKYDLKEDPEREEKVLKFISGVMNQIDNNIRVNDCIDFYSDDYKNLMTKEHKKINISRQDVAAFQNVISCKNNTVTAISSHPLISGIIAAAYAKTSCNEIYYSDTVDNNPEFFGLHFVLIWSLTNNLKPILYLQARRDVRCVSFCPLNPNIIVGGCDNGQIFIWDITEDIKNCEQNVMLTELQQKHRVIIYSHMNWLKNIEDIPVIEPVVVSNIDFGHKSRVTDITWMPSNYEIKQNRYVVECDKINHQFFTCGEDSIVYLWDLNTDLEIISEPIIISERLKHKPPALVKRKSHLDKFNKVLTPHYKFPIEEPEYQTNIPLTKISILPQNLTYIPSNPNTVTNVLQRTYYDLKIDNTTNIFSPGFTLTSNTGQLLKHTWQPHDIDPEAEFVETYGTVKCMSIHDGPIDTCLRNPFIPELLLTVGGKIFAIWNEKSEETFPIVWRKNTLRYLNGMWSSYHPGIVIMFRCDSHFEIWDMLEQTKVPDYVIRYTGNVIVDGFYETDKNHVRKNTYCTIDNTGAIKVYKVPVIPYYRDDLVQYAREIFFKHEFRIDMIKEWIEEWKIKYLSDEQKDDKSVLERPRSETRPDEISELKGIIKWFKFQDADIEFSRRWNEKQFPFMYKILIDRRKLNLKEIEERRQPLITASKHQQNRDKKEKLLLSNKDEIFNQAKRLLCDEIKINERRELIASLTKKSAIKIKSSYISEYKNIEQSTLEYIKSNTFQHEFNWNKMINDGIIRRKVFNTHIVKENLHRKRWNLKKEPLKEEVKICEPKIEKLKKNVQDIIFIKKHIIS